MIQFRISETFSFFDLRNMLQGTFLFLPPAVQFSKDLPQRQLESDFLFPQYHFPFHFNTL